MRRDLTDTTPADGLKYLSDNVIAALRIGTQHSMIINFKMVYPDFKVLKSYFFHHSLPPRGRGMVMYTDTTKSRVSWIPDNT